MSNRTIPLRITTDEHGKANVTLGTTEHLEHYLLSGGLKIEYERQDVSPDQPTVTMVFAPGALAFEFDAYLLSTLLSEARTGETPAVQIEATTETRAYFDAQGDLHRARKQAGR